ncbi:MAG TPA: methyltransferase domain-containing protein [Flavobacterium sp.]|nr:methyltransferase domain-containing protein [Flavobacterium sp.]
MKLNKEYWSERYTANNTPWDAGEITTPIKAYIDQLTNKDLKILVPGVGNGYELKYLYENGFKNVFGLDILEEPLKDFLKNNPSFPKEQLLFEDFFAHDETYDLILEQTFFCAIDPNLRSLYVDKINELLAEKGTLAGVLFSFPLTQQGPPFGGNQEEYKQFFQKYFKIKTLAPCYNSIKPRKNNELFIVIKK